MMKLTAATATVMSTAGYISAEITWERRCMDFSRKSARRSKMASRWPLVSPARTMLT